MRKHTFRVPTLEGKDAAALEEFVRSTRREKDTIDGRTSLIETGATMDDYGIISIGGIVR